MDGYGYFAFRTAGMTQLASRVEGGSSFGQYIRMVTLKSPSAVGSQFASLSFPGDLRWM